MGSRKQTAVNLNEFVQQIKDSLTPIYGLKNILSAGLLLFSRLSDSEQKKTVAEVNKMAKSAQEADEIVSAAETDTEKQRQKVHHKPSKAG